MNEFFNNLKNEAMGTKLSPNEKQRMRVALHEHMKAPQAPVPQPVRTRVRSPYVWISFIASPRFAIPVAVLLIMGLGTGTAFAAQGSLPGDALYPIKINVEEPVEVAIAPTPAAKAAVEETIANRRVVEAQTLAAQGRLDATTTEELEDNFDQHASSALAYAAEASVATTSATTSPAISTATTTATTTPATASATSTETARTFQHKENGGSQTPRAGTFKFASTTPVATSSEAEAPAGSNQNGINALSASFQSQRKIFGELRQHIGSHGQDATSTATTTGADARDNKNNGRNDDNGGDNHSFKNF